MSDEQTPKYTPETDPERNLRSDLWPTMSLSQLARQQEIASDKVSKMHSLMSMGNTQSITNLYAALQIALKELNTLIDNRAEQK